MRRVLSMGLLCLSAVSAQAQKQPEGYDVILIAGQSNASGRAPLGGTDPDGAVDSRVFMWDPVSGIVQAKDPLVHQEPRQTNTAGIGMSLAKQYLRTQPATRKVLLVGAAYGGTSFIEDVTAPAERWNFSLGRFETVSNLHRRWMATDDLKVGGDLYRGAVRRANDAMAAAGLNARFAGVVWHQGESDAVAGGADSYAANHRALIDALRANVTGAGPTTPVVVGEFNPCFLAACPDRTGTQPTAATFNKILGYFHTLRSNVQYTAFVSSAGLGWMSDGTHFDLLSERELGRRYAAKLFEAKNNLPQPAVDFKIYNNKYFDVGTSIDADPLNSRIVGNVTPQGSVAIVADASRGWVAQIKAAQGSFVEQVDGALFNSSYTKMAWVKLSTTGFTNNLVSALNPTQRHHLNLASGRLQAGHGSTTTVTQVQSPKTVSAGVWAHVAVVYDAKAQTMTLYENGAKTAAAKGVAAAPAVKGTADLQMSRYGSGSSSYGIDGFMIDNKVYPTTLTAAQVLQVYDFEKTYKATYRPASDLSANDVSSGDSSTGG